MKEWTAATRARGDRDSQLGRRTKDALAAGKPHGGSDVFTYTQIESVPPLPSDQFMWGFRAFAFTTVTPEPSVVALGLLGIAGLLLIRRRIG